MRPGDWIRRFSKHPKQTRVSALLVTQSNAERRSMMEIAQHSDWDLALADSREHAAELMEKHRFTIIVCDRDLPGLDWRGSMQALVTAAPASCILLASSVSDDYLWQEVIQRGGYDVLTKPFKGDAVAHAINQAAWYWATRAAQQA